MRHLLKKLGWLLFISLAVFTYYACEKDDIAYHDIEGIVTDADNNPLAGVILVGPDPEMEVITDMGGFFSFTGIPEGDFYLDIIQPKETVDPETGEVIVDWVELTQGVKVTLRGPRVITIEIKIEIKIEVKQPVPPPQVDCRPWSGIVSTSQPGEPARVVAGGGAVPSNPCNARTTVKVTKPNGEVVDVTPGNDGQRFEPAEPGVWKVETTVDGKTVSSTVTVKSD